jgi:hypothetical protein
VTMPVFPVDPALLAAARRAVPRLPAQRKAGREIAVSVGGTGVAGAVFLDNARTASGCSACGRPAAPIWSRLRSRTLPGRTALRS